MKTKIQTFKQSSALMLGALAVVSTAQASSDYGPAIWNPACNGHWYTSGYGHKFHVVHDMEGYYLTTISYFQNCATSASVHYCVNGLKDTSTDHAAGEITQMVLEAYYAWHVLCWNQYCTGTEHEGFASNPAWYTEAMYQASAGISGHEADKFGYPKDRNHIVGHNEKSSAAWVAYAGPAFGINATCNSHTDPGPYWDWNHYMSLMNPVNNASTVSITAPAYVTVGSAFSATVVMNNNGGTTWTTASLYRLGSLDNPDTTWGFNRVALPATTAPGQNATFTFTATAPTNAGTYSFTWKMVQDGVAWFGTTASTTIIVQPPLHLDVFIRGTDNALWHKWTSNNGWQPGQFAWESFGGVLASDPASVCWASGRIDTFYRGTDNTLQHKFYINGSGWSAVESLGGNLVGKPAVSSLGSGKLDVFVRGTDNALWHKSYNSTTGWYPGVLAWESFGGTMASDPCAVSWATNRIDVFYKGTDTTLQHKYWNSTTGWIAVESLGGALAGAPTVASWGATRLDVFTRGSADNALWHKYYDGVSWQAWESRGGVLTSDPGAVSGRLNRIDVFMRGTDNAMWHTWYDTVGWNPNESLGGTLVGAPSVASWTHTN